MLDHYQGWTIEATDYHDVYFRGKAVAHGPHGECETRLGYTIDEAVANVKKAIDERRSSVGGPCE